MNPEINGLWRPPFRSGAADVIRLPVGATLAEFRESMPGLPPDFDQRGTILIDEMPVDREHWHRVRPKPGHRVTMHYALGQGGEGSGSKAVLGLVVAVATVLSAGWAAVSGFPFLGAAFGPGALGAKVLAAGISVAGSLAPGGTSILSVLERGE